MGFGFFKYSRITEQEEQNLRHYPQAVNPPAGAPIDGRHVD